MLTNYKKHKNDLMVIFAIATGWKIYFPLVAGSITLSLHPYF